jgi:uncharacterized protein
MRATVLALTIALTVPTVCLAQGTAAAQRPSPEIVTAGIGVVNLKPDRATVTVAVVTRAASAAEAGRLNTGTMLHVIAALKRQQLADSAIVTTGYAVYLDRGDGMPRPVGAAPRYVARNALRVTVLDLEALGRLVDTALVSGATEIANITFASSQELAARQRAIASAVRAARVDAEAAATAAGGSLGDLIELSLVPEFGGMARAMVAGGSVAMEGAAQFSPLMPRDVTVQVQARLRYGFVARP